MMFRLPGTVLHTYQKILHDKFHGKIHYLVGVARPQSEEDWNRRKRILKFSHKYSLDFVEKVILPDWDNSTCPWCQEKNVLKEVTESGNYENLAVTRKLELRLNELNQAETSGLTNDVFFSIKGRTKPAFMGGSIFCNKSSINESDLVASIASTIQHLRNGYTNKADGEYYQLAVGHPSCMRLLSRMII